MIKTFICDDERLARTTMQRLLSAYDDIEIVGEAAIVSAAVEKIEELQPDVVFLDIQMPGGSGFDLVEKLNFLPKIIFVTAYDDFAVKAFEENAFDYLLKPVSQKRLDKTIEKIRNELIVNKKSDNSEKIFLKTGSKYYFVSYDEISHISSVGNYSKFHFGQHSSLLYQSLKKLEERLPESIFFRANRQEIINLNYIESMNEKNGEFQVKLKNGYETVLSERSAIALKKMFK